MSCAVHAQLRSRRGLCRPSIGEYLSREEKLEKIKDYRDITGIQDWLLIAPDAHGDWLKQRNTSFSDFIVIGDKKRDVPTIFESYSQGVVTNRDSWAYNSSSNEISSNMSRMIEFYNSELDRFNKAISPKYRKLREESVDGFIETNPEKISWTRALKQELVKGRNFQYEGESLTTSLYRPFTKQWLYFNRTFNEMVLQMPRLFPDSGRPNLAIMTKGNWRGDGHFALMIDQVPCLQPDGGAQCFPLYIYSDEIDSGSATSDIFDEPIFSKPSRRDAITDLGLAHFQMAYQGETISKEDLFYYVYGLLHSSDYRTRFADNLGKELPRIPRVKTAVDFWDFSLAGRKLGDLHINYEKVELYPVNIVSAGKNLSDADYRVEKMRIAKKGKDKDLSILHYNDKITLTGIPVEAFDYIVNGKPALDWVIERQGVKVDKDSGIVNDANDWAVETMDNPRYPLELFQRVITVCLETQRVVKGLPKLDLLEASTQ